MPTTVALHKTMENWGLVFTSASLSTWSLIPTLNPASISIKLLPVRVLPPVLDHPRMEPLPNPLLKPRQNPRRNPRPSPLPKPQPQRLPLSLPRLLRPPRQPLNPQPPPKSPPQRLRGLQRIVNMKAKSCLIQETVISTTGVTLTPTILFTSKFSLVVIGPLILIKALVCGQTLTMTFAPRRTPKPASTYLFVY